ncbi:flavohemoglobin expression-modulating QEGLA motif protein [Moritella sp. F3]|uniref:flavohemoglobin expression-modulating QEGLA motif protein n=1 Tax=Moritella sp. F3 TaxID=2718882 RepID=UPI0018E0C843|nr:flavohemoglobin expression-modulating QEGLA motif protein [Moritella sp. F3]GIC79565.1 N-formylglutamate amidohydrolase [Moritella sp. F1]GIC79887.1 N-formylglutamate amidohydrolase [Moritella sp. F3]
MQRLTEKAILNNIRKQIPFTAQLEDGSLTLRISEYQPHIATAIHHGHQIRDALSQHIRLTEQERYYEEDPFTGDFISSQPIVLQVEDSRYEYDLNRPLAGCVYKTAWGKDVWSDALPTSEIALSKAKHSRYYRILKCLISTLEAKFGLCLLYDIHAYNYQRIETKTPTFNIGTQQLNSRHWRKVLDNLQRKLKHIELPNITVSVAENDVFKGLGYQASFVTEHFRNTLIMPIEVKKVYMNEVGGESFPLVIEKLKEGMKTAINEHAAATITHYSKGKRKPLRHVLSSSLPTEVVKLDKDLYALARGINTLNYITPKNLKQEKKRFLHNPFSYQPNFTYRQLDIDPYKFKENLYRLPVETILDADIQKLYRTVIEQLAMRIDLLASIGTEQFLYNSLRYYGEPNKEDISNAKFILHACEYLPIMDASINAASAVIAFQQAAGEYGVKCKVVEAKNMIARAMVSGRTIKVNNECSFNETDLNALIHHELGVHLLTTANAEVQPLHIFKLGLPGNTHAQEGLAILCEYLSGNLPLHRLKTLALRVIAVSKMVAGESFNQCYLDLINDHNVTIDDAFTITLRAYRGGGFTKDYLYLRGLKEALQMYKQGDISSLFIGKTGFDSKVLLDELIARGILKSPHYVPKALSMKSEEDAIMTFILDSI